MKTSGMVGILVPKRRVNLLHLSVTRNALCLDSPRMSPKISRSMRSREGSLLQDDRN